MAGIKTRSTFKDVHPKIRTAMRSAMHNALDHVLDEANKMVPHDEGTLQGTGTVTLHKIKLTGYVSYNTPYAVRLHEHPEYNFQRGRRGKWLEIAVEQEKSSVQNYLHDQIKKAFK